MWDSRLEPRTPMPGVFLCGACTHPGGSVIAVNGRNAAAEHLGPCESGGLNRSGRTNGLALGLRHILLPVTHLNSISVQEPLMAETRRDDVTPATTDATNPKTPHANRDPISGEPGAAPVGRASARRRAGRGPGMAGGRRRVRPEWRSARSSAASSAGSRARARPSRSTRPPRTPTCARTMPAGPYHEAGNTYDDYPPAYQIRLGIPGPGTPTGHWDPAEPDLDGGWDSVKPTPACPGTATSSSPATPGTASRTGEGVTPGPPPTTSSMRLDRGPTDIRSLGDWTTLRGPENCRPGSPPFAIAVRGRGGSVPTFAGTSRVIKL